MKKLEVVFAKPHIPENTIMEIDKVLKSGWITTGHKAKEFEEKFSEFLGTGKSLAVANGTAALHLAYAALEIGPGDEVVVPSFTFCSTINMLVHLGATPIFADIDEETLCLDPNDVEKKITPKTKAIVVVHFAGKPAPIDKFEKIVKGKKIKIIEDVAHAFMTKYKGKYIGSGKNLYAFSFYATKNLTTAEGGIVIGKNKRFMERIRILSMHGISKQAWNRYGKEGTWKYDVLTPGYKYNMTDIQAVIGLSQLEVANESRSKRLILVNRYLRNLSKNENLILPSEPTEKGSRHAWHLFTIRLNKNSDITRDELFVKLKEYGIGTSVHFIPNHMQSFYKKTYGKIKLPVTEKVFKSILSLPLYEDLTTEQVDYVCEVINKFV